MTAPGPLEHPLHNAETVAPEVQRIIDDLCVENARLRREAASYPLLLAAIREALLYLSTTDIAYEPLERAMQQIKGYPPSPMDTCTRCWAADGPSHECVEELEPCCVPGCRFPRLRSSACCYGHTVDESDPRHLPPAHIDGDR